MIKTILLDLDDTLLYNPVAPFVEGYLKALTHHFLEAFPSLETQRLREGLLIATRSTVTNLDPVETNLRVFYRQFAEITQLRAADVLVAMEMFMNDGYCQLASLTSPIASAPSLIRWLHDHQYAVAVATNPLFQKTAIEHRIRWAGLNPETFWFITTMENTHFTKPNPHYYEEILTRLGFEPDEALMVGDDWKNDIVPANQAGLNTFWITNGSNLNPETDGQGTLANLLDLVLHEGWLDTLQPRPLRAEQIPPRFLGNVAALMGMVYEIPRHFWNQHPDPNEWSPLEVVVHLRDSERNVQRKRLERILKEDNPFLVAPQPPPDPYQQHLDGMDGVEVALEFAEERHKTLALLENLTPGDWTRPARHSVFGPTNLLEMTAFTARHDRLHIKQLCQTIGKCE